MLASPQLQTNSNGSLTILLLSSGKSNSTTSPAVFFSPRAIIAVQRKVGILDIQYEESTASEKAGEQG